MEIFETYKRYRYSFYNNDFKNRWPGRKKNERYTRKVNRFPFRTIIHNGHGSCTTRSLRKHIFRVEIKFLYVREYNAHNNNAILYVLFSRCARRHKTSIIIVTATYFISFFFFCKDYSLEHATI